MTGVGDIARAGESAHQQAELFGEVATSIERQITSLQEMLRACRQKQSRLRAGGDGEARLAEAVHRVLVDLGHDSWLVLADRTWPGTSRANLDLLLIGPPGVLVIDAKTWRAPRLEHGSIWNDQVCEDDALDALRAQADAVATSLSVFGLAPPAVVPLLALVGRRAPMVEVRGVRVVGERDLQRALLRMPVHLEESRVREVAAALDQTCPPAARRRAPASTVPAPRPAPAAAVLPDSQLDIMSVEDVWDELLTAAQREPMESWMTWLHPAQSTLVTRTFNGPARIRGASGTGKSVVALHRARRLARQPEARVLVTSFVRSLPLVQQQLFDRMAPECGDRVEFLSLHKLAARILTERGSPSPRIAPHGGRTAFREAYRTLPEGRILEAVVSAEDYWWDEESAVIRGRGLTTVEEYLALDRVGRRTPLRESGRRAMWAIHEEYRRRLEARGEADWHDPIEAALASVRETPLQPAFTSVIVDEVQDISCQGLRLLHALVGDREDGLLLVGDGQQRVYVGGCTLSEAGITVPGPRSISLDVNYRNTAEVLDAALEVISGDEFDDLDGDPAPGQREVTTQRAGGQVLQVTAPRDEDHATALISALLAAQTQGVRVGEMAVLVRTNREADTWVATLIDHGCPAELLADYDGRPTDAVKVGTYQRAKGLEFACVFVPHRDRAVPPPRDDETDDAYRERAEMQRRQLFVAMTRARDRLWLGTVTPTMRSPHEE